MTITARSEGLERVLDLIFSTKQAHSRNMIDIYRSIYGLPVLEEQFDVSSKLLEQFKKWEVFVVVAVFNQDKEFLIFSEASKTEENYLGVAARLIAKQVNKVESFSIEEVANEAVRQNCGEDIAELIPLAVVKNKFVAGAEAHTHQGVAFAARLAGEFRDVRDLQHSFVIDPPEEMAYQNKKVFALAKEKIAGARFDPDLDEVTAHKKHWLKRVIHSFVKRATYPIGSGKIRRHLRREVIGAKSIIDVSAGDDRTIIDISQDYEPDLVVANDISWKQMRGLMQEASNKKYYILFSNHHAASLPFDYKFDIAICKNTLHHVANKNEMRSLLKGLDGVAKKIILIDIEEPNRTLRGKIFNWYYEDFYGDGGHDHNFLTQARFRNLISYFFEARKINFEEIETIRGRYLMAVIE